MILSVPGDRIALEARPTPLSKWRRLRLIAPALVVFGVALGLPAFRFKTLWNGSVWTISDFEIGFLVALWTEAVAFDAARELGQLTVGLPTARGMANLTDSWPILVGATANHLFALSCLLALLGRFRLATVLAGVSALAALGCSLPGQFMEWENGWLLGPGYFVWCAAPLVLMRRTWVAVNL